VLTSVCRCCLIGCGVELYCVLELSMGCQGWNRLCWEKFWLCGGKRWGQGNDGEESI